MKTALITGITGQEGSHLADFSQKHLLHFQPFKTRTRIPIPSDPTVFVQAS
jgi:hypothetical protein